VVLNLLVGAASPSVDNWAHLGGLAGGALLAFVIGPNLQWEGRWLVDRPLLRLPPRRPKPVMK
jgi:membrane associated rhomboid family serine protease